jgi:hypothetical protein
MVDTGMLHTLKTIVCLFSNLHDTMPSVLLSLWKSIDFNGDDCVPLFLELISLFKRFPMVVCSTTIGNLPVQPCELGQLLGITSPVLDVKCFAHILNLVLVNARHSKPFVPIMEELLHVQCIFHVWSVAARLGQKYPRLRLSYIA